MVYICLYICITMTYISSYMQTRKCSSGAWRDRYSRLRSSDSCPFMYIHIYIYICMHVYISAVGNACKGTFGHVLYIMNSNFCLKMKTWCITT